MSSSFETVQFTETALRKVDHLLRKAFERCENAVPSIPYSPAWVHRKVHWEELPGQEGRTRKSYVVYLEGRFVISTDESTQPSPWPYWDEKVHIRLTIVPARRSKSGMCTKAVGVLGNGSFIKYSFDREMTERRKRHGLDK